MCKSDGVFDPSPPPPRAPPPLSLEAEWGWFEAWSRLSRLAPCCRTLSSEVCPTLDLFLCKTQDRNLSHSVPMGWTLDWHTLGVQRTAATEVSTASFPEQPLPLAGGGKTWKMLLEREAMTGGDVSMSYGEDRAV